MNRIFLLFLLLFSFNGFGQLSQLDLYINASVQWQNDGTNDCYSLVIRNSNADTIVEETILYSYDELIDSLQPGNYNLSIYSSRNLLTPEVTRNFQLQADSLTTLSVSYDVSDYKTSIVDEAFTKNRTDAQISLGYFNNNWILDHPVVTSSFSGGFSGSQWYAFSRHVGFLIGGGMGFTHTSIAKDTTFMNQPLLKKRYEYYNYLDAHFEVKFRLSTGNQQLNELNPSKWMIDLGARYYFPLVFKHYARYEGNDKFTESRLHQYTDCRVFVNFGYAPVLFFAEYRLFDFVMGNNPELPTYNFGIRINLQG